MIKEIGLRLMSERKATFRLEYKDDYEHECQALSTHTSKISASQPKPRKAYF